jgi:hypothetical protein
MLSYHAKKVEEWHKSPNNPISEPKNESTRWGIQLEEVRQSARRLNDFLETYHDSFQTKTPDKSEYAYGYVSGLLRIETEQNMADIARKTGIDKQNTQHFMSYSPW